MNSTDKKLAKSVPCANIQQKQQQEAEPDLRTMWSHLISEHEANCQGISLRKFKPTFPEENVSKVSHEQVSAWTQLTILIKSASQPVMPAGFMGGESPKRILVNRTMSRQFCSNKGNSGAMLTVYRGEGGVRRGVSFSTFCWCFPFNPVSIKYKMHMQLLVVRT